MGASRIAQGLWGCAASPPLSWMGSLSRLICLRLCRGLCQNPSGFSDSRRHLDFVSLLDVITSTAVPSESACVSFQLAESMHPGLGKQTFRLGRNVVQIQIA